MTVALDLDLDLWARFCTWLEEQPYNATYSIGVPSEFQPLIADDRRARRQRKELQVIYWRTGQGWQLLKDYREKLAARGVTVPAPPPPPKRVRKRALSLAQLRLLYRFIDAPSAEPQTLEGESAGVCERLVAAGYLSVEPPGDSALPVYQITPAGRKAVKRAFPASVEAAAEKYRYREHFIQIKGRYRELATDLYYALDDDARHRPWDRQAYRLTQRYRSLNELLDRARQQLIGLDHTDSSDYCTAVEWARALVEHPQTWLVLDTETTGLGYEDEIVQIGLLAPDGTVLLDTLIRPTKPIPAAATAIHGITNEHVQDAPTMTDVYITLQQVIGAKNLVIYNAEFDRRMLKQSLQARGLPPLGLGRERFLCAMGEYATFCGEWSNYFQSYKWQPLGGEHTAIGDCRACLAVIQRMAAARIPEVDRV
jgi:DNA polymerase-3 subunit epsilon